MKIRITKVPKWHNDIVILEAERARAAFEALSPEEQTALMQQRAEQEAMAQQQANMQQATPEELAMAQQAQMQADGSEAALGQEPQMNSMGGKINKFPWGGYTNLFNVTPPYIASRTAGFIPYDRNIAEDEVLKLEQEQRFKNWTDFVNQNWDDEYVQGYLKALDQAAGGNHLFSADGKLLPTAKDYFNKARTQNHKWGYYHLTPDWTEATESDAGTGKVFHAVVGDDDYLEGDPSTWRGIGEPTGEPVVLPNGDTVVYHDRLPADGAVQRPGEADKSPVGDGALSQETEGASGKTGGKKYKPKYMHNWFGIEDLGPLVALGMQGLGIGRPDISGMSAAARSAGNATLASWMPRGDYAVYRPDDPWFYTTPIMGEARAADRSLSNSSSPSRMAGLLANSYNTTTALGKAQREALNNNFSKYMTVKQYNGTINDANQREFGQTSRFNAGTINDAARTSAQLNFQAAQAKAAADRDWYGSIYGNIGNIFEGLGKHRKENRTHNMIADMAANELFGVMTPDSPIGSRYLEWVHANGGKLKKKSKRGLTI